MNENKVFLDTNILIYAFDISAEHKNQVAKDILIELWDSKKGIISTQVIQEFFVNVTNKIPNPIDIDSAETIIKDMLHWEVIVVDETLILNAIEIYKKYGFSFWDSMIIQSAVRGRVNLLYSEDMTHEQVVQGVRIVNPF